jgi:hypothetical protein
LEHKCLIHNLLSMRILICIVFIVLCLTFRLSAQKFKDPKFYTIERKTLEEFREDRFVNEGGFIGGKIKYAEVSGTPYLCKDFKMGKVLITDGTLVDSCLLRYNIYADQVENRVNGVVYEIAPKSKVKRAEIDGNVLTCLKFEENGKIKDQYFEVLAFGRISLYKRYTLKFIPPVSSFPYNKTDSAHFTLPVSSFYLSNGSLQIMKVKNRKELLKVLEDKKSEVGNFISGNKLSVGKEADLLKIMAFYNAL